MGKIEYLETLKRAMGGLPPELVAKTLAYYEQRFIDGVMACRSEEDIAKELDEPRKIAMTLRANAHLSAFEQRRNPANLARMLLSLLGLTIFNLFMVIPAMVYSALLLAVYASAFALYISGIAITASGLAGANELVLDGPLRHLIVYDNDGDEVELRGQTKVSINESGVQVYQEPVPGQETEPDDDSSRSERLLESAESVAGSGVRISTDPDSDSRATQTVIGVSLVIGGILLCLLSLVITKYTVIGVRRYVQMNFALLRGR